MKRLPLACTVRGCGQPLERTPLTWTCPRGHSFDIARAGYVNLLQPQDRRSMEAGDARSAVDARARLFERGIGQHVIDAVVSAITTTGDIHSRSVVAELGSGTGHLLDAVHARFGAHCIGIDLAIRAVEIAARRASSVQWVVANADRRLPLLDGRVDLLLSINARRNPSEAARVLTPEGRLLVGIPADDDLIELREAVQGGAMARERVGQLVDEHSTHFSVVGRSSVRETRTCAKESLEDLLLGTYRGGRHANAARVSALETLEVTLATELVEFRRLPSV
ncbi:MAG: putative RNA methyltransferase [Vicinamibacterales bacterium]